MGLKQRFLFTGTRWLRWLFPQGIWRIKSAEKVLYLTFDDGPMPEVTTFVLDQLALYQAKATFFVIGDNVRKYPEIIKAVLEAGHAVGNHTENHLNGTHVPLSTYLANVNQCQARLPVDARWFRPPYGRLTFAQYRQLRKTHTVFFWDVLSQDYDHQVTPEECLEGTLNAIRPGSLVVFHDSWKAWPRLSVVLPQFLATATAGGYRFEIPNLDIPPIR